MSKHPSWPLADDLSPLMRSALKAWPHADGHRTATIRALRSRGLLLPRGITTLGDRVIAYLGKECPDDRFS